MSALPALTWWSSQRRHLVAPWLLECSLTKRTDVDAVGFWCGEQLGWMVTVGHQAPDQRARTRIQPYAMPLRRILLKYSQKQPSEYLLRTL